MSVLYAPDGYLIAIGFFLFSCIYLAFCQYLYFNDMRTFSLCSGRKEKLRVRKKLRATKAFSSFQLPRHTLPSLVRSATRDKENKNKINPPAGTHTHTHTYAHTHIRLLELNVQKNERRKAHIDEKEKSESVHHYFRTVYYFFPLYHQLILFFFFFFFRKCANGLSTGFG